MKPPDVQAPTALYQGRDRHLTGDAAWWVDPEHPLPQGLFFVPTDPAAHRGSSLGWAIVAGLALLGVPGMLYLGEKDFVYGLLAVAAVAAALAFFNRSRARRADARRRHQLAAGNWRFGRFASPEVYLVRESKDFCFAVPRQAVTGVHAAEQNISINERNQYREISMNIHYRLPDGSEVGFQDFQRQAPLSRTDRLEAVRELIEQQCHDFQQWVQTGDMSALRRAFAARRQSPSTDTDQAC